MSWTGGQGRRRLALFGAVSWALLWISRPGNRSEAEDVFDFAFRVEHGRLLDVLVPRQPLWISSMRGLRELLGGLGITVSADSLMRLTSCTLASAALVLLLVVLRDRFGVQESTALVAAIGLGVSYGFWRYSAEAEVYPLTNASVLAVLYLGLRRPVTPRWQATTVGVSVIAVAANFVNLLPVLVVVGGGYLITGHPRVALRHVTVVVVLMAVGSFALYQVGARPQESYVTYYSAAGGASVPSPTDLVQAPVGLGQDVAAGNFMFGLEPVADAVVDAFPARNLTEELYAGSHTSPWVTAGGVVTALLLAALLVATIVDVRRRTRERPCTMSVLLIATWLIGIAAIIALTGDLGAAESWTPTLVPIWILAGVVVLPSLRHPRLGVALVLVLAVHNLVGGLLPVRDRADDLNVVRGSWLVEHATSRDRVLVTSPTFQRWLRYQSDAEVVDLSPLRPERVRHALEAQPPSGGRLLVTDDVLDPPTYFRNQQPAITRLLVGRSADLCATSRLLHTEPEVRVFQLDARSRPDPSLDCV